MPNVDRANRAYERVGWRLRQTRMFVAFTILGGLVGVGVGLIGGVFLSLVGLPYWAAITACVGAGLAGTYLGFARWHLRYTGRH